MIQISRPRNLFPGDTARILIVDKISLDGFLYPAGTVFEPLPMGTRNVGRPPGLSSRREKRVMIGGKVVAFR
jgi:hypothetical protein